MKFVKSVAAEMGDTPLASVFFVGLGLASVGLVMLLLTWGFMAAMLAAVGGVFMLVPVVYAVSVVTADRSAGVTVYRG